MSIRLFACYFVALAACSTLAFTQFGPDSISPSSPPSEPPYSQWSLAEPEAPLPPAAPAAHRRKTIHLPQQMVQANLRDWKLTNL